jgi:hypothetical protein
LENSTSKTQRSSSLPGVKAQRSWRTRAGGRPQIVGMASSSPRRFQHRGSNQGQSGDDEPADSTARVGSSDSSAISTVRLPRLTRLGKRE